MPLFRSKNASNGAQLPGAGSKEVKKLLDTMDLTLEVIVVAELRGYGSGKWWGWEICKR